MGKQRPSYSPHQRLFEHGELLLWHSGLEQPLSEAPRLDAPDVFESHVLVGYLVRRHSEERRRSARPEVNANHGILLRSVEHKVTGMRAANDRSAAVPALLVRVA